MTLCFVVTWITDYILLVGGANDVNSPGFSSWLPFYNPSQRNYEWNKLDFYVIIVIRIVL